MNRTHGFAMLLLPAVLSSALILAQPTDLPTIARGRFPGIQADEVRQKLILVDALLVKSPAMARIEESRNQEAKGQAIAARKLHRRAEEALLANDLGAADGYLNDALRLISTASKSVPDPEQTLAEKRAEYVELLQKIETFQLSYQKIKQRGQIKPKLESGMALDVDRIRTMVKAADALESTGYYVEANKILAEAHDITVSTLNKLVSNETFVYDLRFSSTTDEFLYELDRHRSYEELIPVAVATLRPTAEANRLIDRYFEQSERLKTQAQEEAAKGEHKTALATMRTATDHLQKALQSVGIVVPQSMDR